MRLFSHLLKAVALTCTTLCLVLVLVLVLAPAAHAADGAVLVTKVIDGNSLLVGDNTVVYLYGIQAPQAATKETKAWPHFKKSKEYLEKLALNKSVSLRLAAKPQDRMSRTQAEVVLPDGQTVQEAMIKAGMARVYTTAETAAIAPSLYPLERKARADKLGIWALPAYAVQTIDSVINHVNQFQIVEGTVVDVAVIDDVTYLNFGANWRTDFTVSLPTPLADQVGAAEMKGQSIRVRGWVHDKNGPMINVSHAAQIEIIETNVAPPSPVPAATPHAQ